MLLRRERPGDTVAIDEVHRQAFAAADAPAGSDPVEVRLVHALREDRGWVPALSIVAEDGAGAVIGHVVATEASVEATVAIGLGPIGVLPKHQRRQVGHALMHAVLAAADALDYPVVGLVGHADYYPRFGFVRASSLGIVPPDPRWGENFQARTLATYRPEIRGAFRFAAPFERV